MGTVVFDSATCERITAGGEAVILIRKETAPEDVKAIHSAAGVLTQLGGMTSHAAVVTQGWGKPCITGCSKLMVNEAEQLATLGGRQIHAGDVLSLNGTTGEVLLGAAPVAASRLKGSVQRFLSWVDEYRTMGVRANADTPSLAKQVRQYLCVPCARQKPFVLLKYLYHACPGSGQWGRGSLPHAQGGHLLWK